MVVAQSGFVIRILGHFELVRDGLLVDTAVWRPRVRSLFLLVGTSPLRRRLRDEVIDMLWPDATPESGSGNLRYTLHMLRRALGNHEPSSVLFEQGWIALNPAYSWEIDVDQFEELVGSTTDDIDVLERAVALYRGDPLEEFRYEDWTRPVREHVHGRWRDLCLRLGGAYRDIGSHQQATACLERLLEIDPLHERAMQDLLPLLVQMGRRAEALRRYDQFERRLREELDVSPAPDTIALIDSLKYHLGDVPALAEKPPIVFRRRRLAVIPRYPLLTDQSFVGRDNLLARMTAVLAHMKTSSLPHIPSVDNTRLILVAGEAGMGKTRLLSELARRARDMDFFVLGGACYEHEGRASLRAAP